MVGERAITWGYVLILVMLSLLRLALGAYGEVTANWLFYLLDFAAGMAAGVAIYRAATT